MLIYLMFAAKTVLQVAIFSHFGLTGSIYYPNQDKTQELLNVSDWLAGRFVFMVPCVLIYVLGRDQSTVCVYQTLSVETLRLYN
jgi:hypothetical protein